MVMAGRVRSRAQQVSGREDFDFLTPDLGRVMPHCAGAAGSYQESIRDNFLRRFWQNHGVLTMPDKEFRLTLEVKDSLKVLWEVMT